MSDQTLDAGDSAEVASAPKSHVSAWYKHYTLLILTLVYASSFMDRQITAILIEDLKEEFTLSDVQMGLLSGLAFAVFYATLGMPIARLADRYNRVNIITIAITIWSGMTALSGAAMSYGQLLLARIGVGVGEAGASPPSHSIISDYYKPSDRPLALSIWALGTVIGSLAGLILGGYIAEHYGWRWAFIAAGAPGLVLAVMLKFTVREPLRGHADKKPAGGDGRLGFWASIVELWNNRIYRHATVAHVLSVFFGYSLAAWLPAFFIRQWGLTTSEVGAIVGTTVAVAGISGLLAGGAVTSWMSKRFNRGWEAWVPAIVLILGAPVCYFGLNAETAVYGAILIGGAYFLYQCMHGPGLAIVQSSVSPDKRAFAAAVMYFVSNISALGLGPLFVGYISDLQLADTAGDSLKIGLYFGPIALIVASLSYWRLGFRWRDADR